MIAALLAELAQPVARVTTVGCFLDGEQLDVPEHYAGFLETMRRGLAAGGKFAAVEFTSEALALGFAQAWPCRVATFTNLSLDHSDAHPSAEHYLASKAQLFMALRPGGCAVLNARDAAAALLEEVLPRGVEVVHYGVPSRGEPWAAAEISARSLQVSLAGTRADLEPSARFPDLPPVLTIRAVGEIFLENALAALASALVCGVPTAAAIATLARAEPPPGRFQLVHERPYVVIDYAHTPDALTRTLATARALCQGRVSVVFGAGGERDLVKRPLLGASASAADRVWLTSDNPRQENPSAIIEQVASGLSGHPSVKHEADRARAIECALRECEATDLLLIAGKGHEREQQVGNRRAPFSDEAIVRAMCGSDNGTVR